MTLEPTPPARRTPAAVDDGPWLVADIGGTHARFAWVASADATPTHARSLRAADHAGPVEAAHAYLRGLREAHAPAGAAADEADADARWRPRACAFALATPIDGDHVHFTNSAWSFSRRAVAAALGVERARWLNDFEALALALPGLSTAHARFVGPVLDGTAEAPMAVIGPGTGLGVGAVLPGADGWRALPGEGGHATLAAADDWEQAVIAAARRRHAHVSAERLVSGMGMPLLRRCIAEVRGDADVDDVATARIVADGVAWLDANGAALDGDAAAMPLDAATLWTFCALLGGVAGNVALTLGARGGVFFGGGILPRLGRHVDASPLRARFVGKGRFERYLAPIPTRLILDTDAALLGAADALRGAVAAG